MQKQIHIYEIGVNQNGSLSLKKKWSEAKNVEQMQ